MSATYVANPVAHFTPSETVNVLHMPRWIRAVSAAGKRASITTARIETVIYMAVKVTWAVEPWASADEHSTGEPLGTVVAIRRTGIRG